MRRNSPTRKDNREVTRWALAWSSQKVGGGGLLLEIADLSLGTGDVEHILQVRHGRLHTGDAFVDLQSGHGG
jgi:hypothetical protein